MLLTAKTSSFKRISSRLILASVGRSNSKYLDCPSHEGYFLKQFHLISLNSLSVLIRALDWETLWEVRIKWEICQLWAEMSGKDFLYSTFLANIRQKVPGKNTFLYWDHYLYRRVFLCIPERIHIDNPCLCTWPHKYYYSCRDRLNMDSVFYIKNGIRKNVSGYPIKFISSN